MGSADHLPDEWIRKESTSRPNRFYYFNTKTGKSQWESPKKETNKMQKESSRDASTKKSSKIETSSKGRTSVQNRLKVNDKSKDGQYWSDFFFDEKHFFDIIQFYRSLFLFIP